MHVPGPMRNLVRTLVSLALVVVHALVGRTAFAQATPVTGFVTRVEVHVATAQLRFRVANVGGGGQYICGSSLEAYFPLVAPAPVGANVYTQILIDALRSAVYTARASSIEVDVYTVPDGAACVVTDIVLK